MRFPTAVLTAEFVANTRVSRLRVAVLILVSLLVAGASAFATTAETERLQQRWDAAVAAGRFALVVSTATGAVKPLTAEACESLNSVVGVRSAGADMSTTQVTPTQHPVLSYRLHRVTPGYVAAMWPGSASPSSGVYVGSYVGERLGVVAGADLAVTGAEAPALSVAAVLPESARDPRLDRAVFAPTAATGEVRTCMVDVDPRYVATIESAIRGQLVGTSATIAPLHRANATDSDPQADLRYRTSTYGWIIVAVISGGICLTLWWARRAEFALYRLLGATTPQVLYLLILEALAFVLVPAQLGFLAVTSVLGPDRGVTLNLLAIDNARIVLALLLLPLLGLAITRPTRTLDTLKGA